MNNCMITIVINKYISSENDIKETKQLLDKIKLGAYHNRLNVEGTLCSIRYIKLESGTQFIEKEGAE